MATTTVCLDAADEQLLDRLAKFLSACTVHPFVDGRTVGRLLGRAGSPDGARLALSRFSRR